MIGARLLFWSGMIAGMRVERAFAFTDLSGFTGFTHRHGDDAAREVLRNFRGALRNVVDDHGIRVAKWLGDGAMIVSVELASLVDAVKELHSRADSSTDVLPIRTGLTVGNVIVFEGDDYIGTTVNMAARLCDEADNNEILAHAIVAGRLGPDVTTQSLGTRYLRGIGQPVEVVRIVTLDPRESDRHPTRVASMHSLQPKSTRLRSIPANNS